VSETKVKRINRIPVASSMVKSIGHGQSIINPRLPAIEVEMANGRTYQYAGVTIEQYNNIMIAESVGKAVLVVMHAKVDGKPVYPCVEVDGDGKLVVLHGGPAGPAAGTGGTNGR
jgi:hypothetical protein